MHSVIGQIVLLKRLTDLSIVALSLELLLLLGNEFKYELSLVDFFDVFSFG